MKEELSIFSANNSAITLDRFDRPIGIDLFAGAGGLSLGFEQAGFDVCAAVEIDPIHCAIHHFNFPTTTTICRDVRLIDGSEVRKLAGIEKREIDVVFGGAPCQGFSMIGKRALDDPRNQLVYHFVRLIGELSPKYFVFENVRGLTLGTHRRFLEEVIESLADLGYNVVKDYRVLNAKDYGVPQDRKRLFLMGAKKGCQLPSYPLQGGKATVWEAIGDLPDADMYPELIDRDYVECNFNSNSIYSKKLRGLLKESDNFGYLRHFNNSILTSSMRTVHTTISQERFSATPFGKTEPISRFLKLDPNGVSNTLRAGTGSDHGAYTSPRPIHPYLPRVITVREAARLHSYPDWFRFHVTKWHGFRQIGNSVPPLLGRAVARSIINALGRKPKQPTIVLDLAEEHFLKSTMSSAAKYFGVSTDVIAKRTRETKG